MECLLQCHSCLRVEYEELIPFLTPFVHLLVSNNEGARLYGFRALANTLHLLIDFMDADGSRHVISIKALKNSVHGANRVVSEGLIPVSFLISK